MRLTTASFAQMGIFSGVTSKAIALTEPAPAHSIFITAQVKAVSNMWEADKWRAVVSLYSEQTPKCGRVSQKQDLVVLLQNEVFFMHCFEDDHFSSLTLVQQRLLGGSTVVGHPYNSGVGRSECPEKNLKHLQHRQMKLNVIIAV